MKTKLTLSFSGAVIALLVLAGCSATGMYSSNSQSAPSLTAVALGADATIAPTALGKVVVDGKGMTAYFYDLDSANSGTTTCTGQCAANWPPITSKSETLTITGITGTVGTIKGVAGRKQLTINGRPIYTYVYDTAPGSVNGQGIGGIWYVIAPNGAEIKSAKLVKKGY